MTEGASTSERLRSRFQAQASGLDPYLAYLVFAAVAVGTWRLERHWRMTLLWGVLLAIVLIHSSQQPVALSYSAQSLLRGIVAGLVLGVPLLILARPYLYAFANQLFAPDRGLTNSSQILILLQRMVIIGAVVEELYFRGLLQSQKGLLAGSVAYGLTWFLYFAPGAGTPLLALVIVFVAASLLGFYFSLIYERYGLAAAMVTHAVGLLFLLVLPPAIQELLKALA